MIVHERRPTIEPGFDFTVAGGGVQSQAEFRWLERQGGSGQYQQTKAGQIPNPKSETRKKHEIRIQNVQNRVSFWF